MISRFVAVEFRHRHRAVLSGQSCRSVEAHCRRQRQHDTRTMSRDATELPLGSTAAGGNRLLAEPAFELLLSEIIAYTGAYVSHTAASRATDVMRASEAGGPEEDDLADRAGGSEGSEDGDGGALVEPSPASVGVGNALLPPDQAHQMEARIESMGYEVGYRLVERTCQRRWMGGDQLEAIKFVCKDLWSEVFKKQVDKLQTDHQGTFVLKDNDFRWTSRYAEDDSVGSRDLVARLLQLPCGLVRGALANLGLAAVVRATFLDDRGGASTLPAVSFTIKIRSPGS